MKVGGAILAGGEGRRMGGTDKPSLLLGDCRRTLRYHLFNLADAKLLAFLLHRAP